MIYHVIFIPYYHVETPEDRNTDFYVESNITI